MDGAYAYAGVYSVSAVDELGDSYCSGVSDYDSVVAVEDSELACVG